MSQKIVFYLNYSRSIRFYYCAHGIIRSYAYIARKRFIFRCCHCSRIIFSFVRCLFINVVSSQIIRILKQILYFISNRFICYIVESKFIVSSGCSLRIFLIIRQTIAFDTFCIDYTACVCNIIYMQILSNRLFCSLQPIINGQIPGFFLRVVKNNFLILLTNGYLLTGSLGIISLDVRIGQCNRFVKGCCSICRGFNLFLSVLIYIFYNIRNAFFIQPLCIQSHVFCNLLLFHKFLSTCLIHKPSLEFIISFFYIGKSIFDGVILFNRYRVCTSICYSTTVQFKFYGILRFHPLCINLKVVRRHFAIPVYFCAIFTCR